MSPVAADAPGAADYGRLFAAYAASLLGTGVAVVGFALVAYDLAGAGAGRVIAAALSLKAAAYILVAPLAATLTGRLPKRGLLIGLALVRVAAILALPFADAIWHALVAVAVFTVASAAFTPTYLALVPLLLPDPRDYAVAVSKSRVANELENGIGPVAASALLLAAGVIGILVGAAICLLASAAAIVRARLPSPPPVPAGTLLARAALGPRLLFGRRDLRALAPLHLAASAGVAMVMVNTVGIVETGYGLGRRPAAFAFAAFGLGSVAGALATPRLLGRFGLARVALGGAAVVSLALAAGAAADAYPRLVGLWIAVGFGSAAALTPAPILLRQRVAPAERAAGYAGLFALSNATILVAYPLAGWAVVDPSAPATGFAAMAGLALIATLAAATLLPREDATGRGA